MGDYKRAYCTVVNSTTGQWGTHRIVSNGATSIELESTPTVTGVDKVYLCWPVCQIEFPWDTLDLPHLRKQVVNLALWADGELRYTLAKDWDENDKFADRLKVLDPDAAKKVVYVNKNLEVVKLTVESLAADFRLDSYLWEVEVTQQP